MSKMRLVNAEEVRQIFDYEVAQGATDLFDAFDTAIQSAETVEVAGWIPVAERLPKPGGKVLALIYGRCNDVDYHEAYMLAIFDPGRGWEIDGRPEMWDFCVTYWMPLPESPKEA